MPPESPPLPHWHTHHRNKNNCSEINGVMANRASNNFPACQYTVTAATCSCHWWYLSISRYIQIYMAIIALNSNLLHLAPPSGDCIQSKLLTHFRPSDYMYSTVWKYLPPIIVHTYIHTCICTA